MIQIEIENPTRIYRLEYESPTPQNAEIVEITRIGEYEGILDEIKGDYVNGV